MEKYIEIVIAMIIAMLVLALIVLTANIFNNGAVYFGSICLVAIISYVAISEIKEMIN